MDKEAGGSRHDGPCRSCLFRSKMAESHNYSTIRKGFDTIAIMNNGFSFPPPDQARFLLAEPDPGVREAESRILAEMGFAQITETADGAEAWSSLKKTGADIVIASWNMPDMSGLALLKVARTDPSFYSLPFFLVADDLTKSQVIEAGEAGVSDILVRPFSPEQFKKRIETFTSFCPDAQTEAATKSYQEGVSLMEEEKWQPALDAFRRVLSIYENAEIHYNLGYIKTAQGLYEEAVGHFRRATQINNAFAEAYKKMGECYLRLSQSEEAQTAYEKAAEIYFDKHMDKDAEVVMNEVLKINPNTINVYNSLGIVYRRTNQHAKAVTMYIKALKVSPHDENIHFNLARAYLEIGKVEDAKVSLKACLQVNPDQMDAMSLYNKVDKGSQGN